MRAITQQYVQAARPQSFFISFHLQPFDDCQRLSSGEKARAKGRANVCLYLSVYSGYLCTHLSVSHCSSLANSMSSARDRNWQAAGPTGIDCSRLFLVNITIFRHASFRRQIRISLPLRCRSLLQSEVECRKWKGDIKCN